MADRFDAEFSLLCEMHESLKLSPAFFDQMRGDGDWALVIKCHALLESALKESLARDREQGMREHIYRLQMKGPNGLLTLAKNLQLIDAPTAKFVEHLGSIRNKYAHQVAYLEKPVEEVVGKDVIQNLIRSYWPEKEGLSSIELRRSICNGSVRAFIAITTPSSRVSQRVIAEHLQLRQKAQLPQS